MAAWRTWLGALATDAEAAIAAAHVYGELDAGGRDAWLDALGEDAPKLGVPLVAVYAPLLAVESDLGRRERMQHALGVDDPSSHDEALPPTKALRGVARDSTRVLVLVTPLYLSFVSVLSCRCSPEGGFVWVRHDPILRAPDAPADGANLDGVAVEVTPINLVIEELARSILAQRRMGNPLPEQLTRYSHLFDARVEDTP